MRVSRIRPGTVRIYIRPVGLPVESLGQVECFLAERYLPVLSTQALESRVDQDRAAACALSMRHVQTIYVPSDETCFTLFEAPSLDLVTEANDRFRLGFRRVAPAIAISS